ncbi:MAG: DUF2206 domain-containing protein [Methanobacterium sp.]|uniref:DUF2206 domain-containing protein n=1 Tax=Methanobacterium sp. TaxID=2164 RepID=UPI003D659F69|nr:DUF2206 domain-containing protein [Methanobacterium sp.]
MKVNTQKLFKLNDWKIKNFLIFVLVIQVMMWVLIFFDLNIAIIKPLIGFIYLTFIPGFLILRSIQLHKLSTTKTILYAVGLSLVTVMFVGFFMNMIYPLFGMHKPISIVPLIVTMSILVLFLCVLSYIKDKEFYDQSFADRINLLSPKFLLLLLIPFLAIFGTYSVNFYHNNLILMILILIIGSIAVLVAFGKIPKKYYPFTVFIIALSLLYSQSLISPYIWGADVAAEYYLSHLVQINAIWNPNIPWQYNGMLSVVMILPIYAIILDTNIIWIIKIIYPFFLALVPFGLYRVFKKQTSSKVAFLACFYFMSVWTFYTELLWTQRQIIAEFFLISLVLLILDEKMNDKKKLFIIILFIIALTVSHYSLTYIFILSLIFVLLASNLMDNSYYQKLKNNLLGKLNIYKNQQVDVHSVSLKNKNKIIIIAIISFIIFAIPWYTYFSSSIVFTASINASNQIASNISSSNFLNPQTSQGLYYLTKITVSMLHSITKYLYVITQIFITIGVLALLLKKGETKFSREYKLFAIVSFLFCIASVLVPNFSGSLDTVRVFQITLIFLAPVFVIGVLEAFKALYKIIRKSWGSRSENNVLKILSVFLVIFLLFNTGWVYEISKDPLPGSVSLSTYSVNFPVFNNQEVLAGNWWSEKKTNDNYNIYSDFYRYELPGSFQWAKSVFIYNDSFLTVPENSYIFLGSWNIINDKIYIHFAAPEVGPHYIKLGRIVDGKNKIYENGGAAIWR